MQIVEERVDAWMVGYNKGPLAALHDLLASIEVIQACALASRLETEKDKKNNKKNNKKKKKKKKKDKTNDDVYIRTKTFPIVPLVSLGRMFVRSLTINLTSIVCHHLD